MITRLADHISIITETGEATAQGTSVSWKDAMAQQALTNSGLTICLEAEQTAVRYLLLRWNFRPDEKRTEQVKILGDAWERGYGNLEWRGVVAERCMPWVFAASNGSDQQEDHTGRSTECWGVKVRPAAFCAWQYDPQGVTLWLDVRCGGKGVILNGRRLEVCTVVMETYQDVSAFQALQTFYRLLSPSPLPLTHPVYGSNNWYYAYGKSSHEEILSDSRFVASLCEGLENRPYMVIDDGWQPNVCDGPWHTGNERFPDMKGLCASMREQGVRPGIWIRYLGDQNHSTEGITPDMRMTRCQDFLDPSHPAVLAKVAEDTRRIVHDWGFELIKHDFSTYDMFGCWGFERQGFLANGEWTFYDRSKTSAEIVINFYQTILDATEGKALILGCNVIGHLAAGLVHLNRTGDDTSGREWDRTRRMGVNTLAFRMAQHKALFDVDADCVGVMGLIDWKLNRQWLKALSLSGTPLFVSCKPDTRDEAILQDLREAFRKGASQETIMVPRDWMETTCPAVWQRQDEHLTFHWYPDTGLRCEFIQ